MALTERAEAMAQRLLFALRQMLNRQLMLLAF